jgi:hypothetical protein
MHCLAALCRRSDIVHDVSGAVVYISGATVITKHARLYPFLFQFVHCIEQAAQYALYS